MKNRLCVIYTPLLSVLVLLSCGSFLLMLSEVLQPRAVYAEVDLSGLHNVSKVKTVSENEVPIIKDSDKDVEKSETFDSNEMTFAETLSLNSVTTDGMEALIQSQAEIVNAIEKVLTNWQKDGRERKTPEKAQAKLEYLENLWKEYQTNHENLRSFEDPSHEYFKQNKYHESYQYFLQVRNLIAGFIKPSTPTTSLIKPASFSFESSSQQLPPQPHIEHPQGENASANNANAPPRMTERASCSKTEEMFRKQKSNFRAFIRTVSTINLEAIKEKWEFEDTLKTLQARWTAIDSLHWELDSILEGHEHQYERPFDYYERKYNDIKKQINTQMWSVSHKEKSTPKMEIPIFNGSYQQWTSFKDLFSEAIHTNASLSNAQKMQFLKGKVKGEAEKLIQHLTISSDNYQTCWDILNHRYNNKKLIFTSHLNTLLGLPNMQHQSAASIKKIHDTTNECLHAIKNLGADTSSWDPILVHLITQKLDADTHNDYLEAVNAPRELPNLQEFLEFLENKFTSLESSRRKQEQARSSPHQAEASNSRKYYPYKAYNAKQNMNSKSYSNNNQATFSTKNFPESSKCPHCQNEHKLYSCKGFLELPSDAKRTAIAKYNLCKNCLYEHKAKECFSNKRCRVCNEKHNTLLHDAYTKTTSLAATHNENRGSAVNSNHVSQEDNIFETLLATALVKVQAADQSFMTLRALIDQGSQISLITEKAAQMLRLSREHCSGVVFGIGAKENNCKGAMNITCMATHSEYTFNTKVLVMRNVINNLPNRSFKKPSWTFLENIKLADPDFYSSRPVDLLLGADIYSSIIQEGIIRHENSQPIIQQTRLGWILCGNVQTYQCNVVLNNVEELHRFWCVEDIAENSNMSQEDIECLQYYKNTTTRNKDGRYIVNLPLQADLAEKLGTSKPMAAAQFKQLEQKFNKQPIIAEAYKKFIDEYQSLNHMVECTSNKTPHCYLPHHCVQRPDSTTTALRVVFNASARTSTGFTLNDLMKRGPNLQQDLMTLIMRWRQYKFAYTADIEKMFRQILISEDHQQLQKILWRNSPSLILREYQLTTITYGMKSAPFLAMMTLKQLAKDEGHKYQESRAAKALQEDFYMDDLVSGSFSLSKAKQLQADLINLLQSGGFNLRKWSSNNNELLENVSKAPSKQEAFDFKQMESTKTLGLKWHPEEDQFTFQINIDTARKANTKRTLLSDISKIFDPIGWLSPTSIKLKLLFKQVWLSNIQWDDHLPKDLETEWVKTRDDLQNINNLKINRWYKSGECDEIELHGFCDASIKAYACVVYGKVNSRITLIAAKTRVVPENKNLTLPRLELCGAHLLCKLISKVEQALEGHTIKTYGWTDSTAVLGWIQGETNRWKPFVANRVKQIKDIVPPTHWYYVKSAENPADCASRGISAEQLTKHSLWWNGPDFLQTFTYQTNKETSNYVTEHEVRRSKQSNVSTRHSSDDVIQRIISKHSNITRAVRVLAWVLRVIVHHHERAPYLAMNELERARSMIIQYVQRTEFEDEINALESKNPVHSKSKILCLNPFLDKEGLLRVGGRIKHSNISEEMKHPIILPHSHHLTDLVIDFAHRSTFHGGARLTLAHTRQNYWIIGGNRAVKKRLHTCTICKKHKASKHQQLMGDLPEARTNPTRPFYHTGVDFTGYVDIKLNKGRGVKTTKGYIAVFVCMVTKAVHLELVSDMSTSAFLGALKRMSSRRGKPYHMYSDNGTNFVGANKVLQQEIASLQQLFNNEFFTELNEMRIQWHFNAPSWPSAGGLWEAAVKSLKHHLRRVVGEQKLTFEEYSTLLAQLEGCLNSRPLCAVTENPDDLDFLTPSHFLSSGPILSIMDTEHDERTRWHRAQQIVQDIWKRWQSEYLSQLSVRSKWKQPQTNIQIDDVVVIHETNIPVGKWALGRVTQLHPGADGLVRVVTLKTKSGYLKRPIIKLTLLPTKPQSIALNENPEQKEQSTSTDYSKTRVEKRSRCKQLYTNLLTIIMTFLFFMTVVSAANSQYNITKLNKALYFDRISSMHSIRDEWKLIVYYDMQPYWDGSATLEKYLKQLEVLCEKAERKTLCDLIILQLRHSSDELLYYNHMFLHQHFEAQRKRRGLINGVGYLANSLFGVLDERFANQYQQDITLIKENQKHLALLWKNQTSVVEAENNFLKRSEEAINKQHKAINHHLNTLAKATNQLNKEIQDAEIMNELALSTIIANNMLTKLKSIQDTLLETITDLHNGMFNIHLFSPKQFRDELNTISGQLPRDVALPVDDIQTNIAKLYHLLRIKARITEQYIIFEMKIPLVSRDNFDLYKVFSIPHQTGNKTIRVTPISDYIAINLRRDTYIAMTENDIQQCLQYNEVTRLCHTQKPVFNFNSDNGLCIRDQITNECRTTIEICSNNWTELSRTNMYLFYCCGQCALRLICEDYITTIQVDKAGVIALRHDCIIKGEHFLVFAHKKHQSKMEVTSDLYVPEIAPINHVINVSVPLIDLNISDHSATLQKISEKIEQMKSETALSEGISYHDVHQFTAIYITMAGCVVAGAVYVCRCFRRRRKLSGSVDLQSNIEHETNDHELQLHTRRHETMELKTISNVLPSTKENKATSPIFKKPYFCDSEL